MNNKFRDKKIKPSEITPEHLYRSRRRFMKSMAAATAGTFIAGVLSACGISTPSPTSAPTEPPADENPTPEESAASASPSPSPTTGSTPTPTGEPASEAEATADEQGNPLTDYEAIIGYTNFYEFTTNKMGVGELAADFQTSPWEVEVTGMVRNPKTFTMEDILKKFDTEERIYRMRCVEGWSMVIPWEGFQLSELLKEVEPTSEAKYVRFVTLFAPNRMPGQKYSNFSWPYVEGLRLDEAMHDLTLLSTGIYGKDLLPQNGAPIRLVVPWKYGFKSIKSIVKIELTDKMPTSLWMAAASHEYGFYANVNPDVPHPRWSQASERRIGESGRIYTELFNGYGEEVAHLYEGMDLKENF
jgi:sulfoxide reductase catalytic subunit YedY